MAEKEICVWDGKSGKKYTYLIYTLPQSFNQGQDGNYIYTKVENNYWKPIYIGEGDLGDRIGPSHHQAKCIKDKEATHVHVHLNKNEQARKSEEKDLLANYPQSFKPEGCNVKTE